MNEPDEKPKFDLTELIAFALICSTLVTIVWIIFG